MASYLNVGIYQKAMWPMLPGTVAAPGEGYRRLSANEYVCARGHRVDSRFRVPRPGSSTRNNDTMARLGGVGAHLKTVVALAKTRTTLHQQVIVRAHLQ